MIFTLLLLPKILFSNITHLQNLHNFVKQILKKWCKWRKQKYTEMWPSHFFLEEFEKFNPHIHSLRGGCSNFSFSPLQIKCFYVCAFDNQSSRNCGFATLVFCNCLLLVKTWWKRWWRQILENLMSFHINDTLKTNFDQILKCIEISFQRKHVENFIN